MHWRKNDVADPARATCTWILEHTKYCEWLDQGQGLLWIKGKPGAGKSTVLKLALETAERETKESSILASYFFHGRGKPIQKNVLGLFRSLLHQMLQQNRDLLSKFTSLYREKCDTEGPCGNKWNWHESQLQTFFKSSVVDTARTHQIRIYIDALDECGQDVALDLVEFFRCFATPISICFSCRHYPFVALEGGNEVCVENENAQDIKAYIQDKIEAHIQQTEIATAIRDEIMSRSEGNFQWVVLVMPRVLKLHKSRKSLATIQTMIRNTPAELKELYTELLDGIEEHERLQSLHFMQWICFAIEPLTLTELRFALVANADTSHTSISRCQRSELYVETNEDMERRVWDLSKGLAEVLEEDEEQIVQFNHQSVNDFLLEKGLQILDNSAAGTVVGRGHFWLSRSSIKFLTMQEVQGFAISLLDMSRLEKSMVEEEEDYFAFLWYSVTFWLLHVEKVENANMPQEDLAVLNFKPTDGILLHSRFDSWFAMYQELQSWSNDCPSEGRTFLHTASEYNLISVVKTLLTQNVLADQKDESSRTPLSIAAERGHELLVDLLVNRDDVDADSKDVRGNTPLFWAAAEGHEAVVEMLMNRDDVDVDSRNLQGHTPFSKAVKSGHERVARLLIVRDDVDADSRDCGGDTPLIKAAQYRFYAIIELLLKRNDVDVNWRNHRGDSLFSVAARSGRKAAVEMLLERGVDLSSENGQLTTALFGASTEGYHEIVTLLLQKNADANARDEENRTPLSWAANYGQYEVVELLLSQGSNADQKDTRGRTPLSYAAGSRGEETVKKFVKRSDVNVDSKDLLGRTPLSYAAGSGGMETVKLLLERSDVNVDSKDLTGRTPLSHAAENGKNETVNLLLERSDVDVNSKDTTGRTPLSYAAECGMEKIVKLLVKRSDIEVLSKDTSGRSALSWALEKVPSSGPYPIEDRMRIVDLLLSRHDISLTGKDQDAFMVYSIWRKANGYT